MLCLLCDYSVAQEGVTTRTDISDLTIEKYFAKESPLLLEAESFSLSADSGLLLHDLLLQLTLLKDNKHGQIPSNMVNTTGDFVEAYRLLPCGEHFSLPARITMPYDPHLIPRGYKAEDIYSFYYDDEVAQWKCLERCSVDTTSHTITSYTTHFTDFANAVIKVPDMPESKAFVPTMMTELPDADPTKGIPMVTIPQANNRGTAELTYPIELPAGRNGLQPNVNLHYSSARGNGVLGVGWSLSMPAITIDTRWGVPRYDPLYETEQYLVNGYPIVLRNSDGAAFALPYQENSYLSRLTGIVRFHARDTKNQNRIVRYGDTPKDYWWAVTDVNGITTYYGRALDTSGQLMPLDTNSIVRTSDGNIAYWAATATVDVHGNYILYENEKVENTIYVREIAYTGNIQDTVVPPYHVKFEYKDRMDLSSSGRLGVLQVEQRLLCHMLVQYWAPNKTHPDYTDNLAAYQLRYSQPKEETLFRSRLEAVVMLDSVHDLILDDLCTAEELTHLSFPRNSLMDDILNDETVRYEDKKEILIALSTKYGKNSIPANTTLFNYWDAPISSQLFGDQEEITNAGNSGLSTSRNRGWNVGGTVTIGVGTDVAKTDFSGGGNYDYSRSTGGASTMLLDIDGDGLTDIVYEDNDSVYYKRQRLDNGVFSFDAARVVHGLKRLVREVSSTHTWGLQLSFGANLSYSRPSTTSYTDTYFSDVNADGLPDMIDGDNILINRLVDSVPTFERYNNTEILTIPLNNSCGFITMDGEVDPHIECELSEIQKTSDLLVRNSGNDDEYNVGYEVVTDKEGYKQEDMNKADMLYAKTPDALNSTLDHLQPNDKQYAYSVDDFYYRVEDGRLNGYILEHKCNQEQLDPNIETIRVWVAPCDGNITLSDSICLPSDESESHARSITANGVVYTIQHCSGVTIHSSDSCLHASNHTILTSRVIEANDTAVHSFQCSCNVMRGDVLLFRLGSRGNNLFDKTHWRHHIKYNSNVSQFGYDREYDSSTDYVCTSDDYFQAIQDGRIVLSLEGSSSDSASVGLTIRQIGVDTCRSLLDTILSPGVFNLPELYADVEINNTIKITMSPVGNDIEPRWSKVHLSPTLRFISDFKTDDYSDSLVHDTVVYYPGVKLQHSSLYSAESPYRKLFGPLHKGWGVFAYQNIENNPMIILDSLVNTQDVAAAYVRQHQNTLSARHEISISANDSTCLGQIDSVFTAHSTYDPIAERSYWIPMRADSRTELWIAYGNMGCVGELVHSNAREITKEAQMIDIIEYDSSLPYLPGSRTKNKFVRKQSKSIQNSLSYGVMGIMNTSVSFGSFESVVDYMDMNGDGYPDFVGKGGVQYSTPWGGIGKLMFVKNFTPFRSSNNASGTSFSASRLLLRKLAGNNMRDGRFYMDASVGVSNGDGVSETKISYVDVNADGLPDKVDMQRRKIRYNLGYSFSKEYDYNGFVNVSNNSSRNMSLGEGVAMGRDVPKTSKFSLSQVSISGGASISSFSDHTSRIFMDVNGDGLPDLVSDSSGSCHVEYNMGQDENHRVVFSSPQVLSSIDKVAENLATNYSVSASATGGISILGIKLNIGIQVSPYSTSISHGQTVMIDMNGDGLTDYVTRGDNGIYVRYNIAGGANLLVQVTNPTGQEIHMKYDLSKPTSAHRQRQWNLVCVADVDGNHPMDNAVQNIAEYEYNDAYYDNYERTDYGYSHVRSISNAEKVKDEYYHNHSMLQNGELWKDVLLDAKGNKYISHIHESRYVDLLHGDEFKNGEYSCDDANVRVSEEMFWTEYYETDTMPQIITACNVTYDRYHNVISYVDSGDISIPDDRWSKTITYLPNSANNMVSLPKEETVADASGNVIRSSYADYNHRGKLIHVNQRTGGFADAVTSLSYDEYGNIQTITFPSDVAGGNDWCKFVYDSILHTYIIDTDNPFSLRTISEYDYRWGLPTRIIDPAGNETRYYYDYKGRLAKVLAPYELANGLDYTVKYSYNLINHNLLTTHPYKHTHVIKDMYDSVFTQSEVTIYDARGRMVQKKHYAEVQGKDSWIVDGADEWDAFGRTIRHEYPFIANALPYQYEPVDYQQAVVTQSYDVMDRPIERINADNSYYNNLYHFRRDVNGVTRLMTQSTDENGLVTSVLRSPQDWTIQQDAGDGSSTLFEYSPIGELVRSTDPDGYQTTYQYDMLGRTISRRHPDSGETKFIYDLAGNLIRKQTANLALDNKWIDYDYKYSRLLSIRYPFHSKNNVNFTYDMAGRISVREDGTGSEEFVYDQMGNIAQSVRRIVIPTDSQAYIFRTLYQYDSFGRMRRLTYPDGEVVTYGYTTGGLLKNVYGHKNGFQNCYLIDRMYDEQGRKTYDVEGNRVNSSYQYNSSRQWLDALSTSTPRNDVLQNIQYKYDNVGNIQSITQTAPVHPGSNMGGAYSNDYQYDMRYRLTKSNGGGTFSYNFNASYSPSGRIGNKHTSTNQWKLGLLYGYDKWRLTHQTRTVFDTQIGTLDYYWDANGNLAQIIGCKQNTTRLHEWDEENRLRFVLGDRYAGYYGYDGNGERVYKLMGTGGMDRVDLGITKAHAFFDDCVLYPNPYFVVTRRGYTKHYYVGTERLATVLGGGGLGSMTHPFDDLSYKYDDKKVKFFSIDYDHSDPFFHDGHLNGPTPTEDIDAQSRVELEYACNPIHLEHVDVFTGSNIVYRAIKDNINIEHPEQEVYYYHSDHLGSANWITDQNGEPVQYLHYAPYGELVENQRTTNYNERYKFTGKERDWESGYDYFGARFYWSIYGHWLSVDPLADKYLWISPYAYCAWNPIKYVDPNGMWSINVSASDNRGQNPYARFEVFDNKGGLLFRTIVRVVGVGGRDRSKVNADTPIGTYEILGWRATGEGTNYDATSYGPNDLLALDYKGTEGIGRNGMHVHGGRNQDELSNTKGCMRMADEDIAELKALITLLEAQDPSEIRTTLEVQNTLTTPVFYKTDRKDIKYNRSQDGFILDEITITPNPNAP